MWAAGLTRGVSASQIRNWFGWMLFNTFSACRQRGTVHPRRVGVFDLKGMTMDARQLIPLIKPGLELFEVHTFRCQSGCVCSG